MTNRTSWFALLIAVCLTIGGMAVAQTAEALKIIDGPRIESVGDTSAKIAWSTNVQSSATVRYGTDRNKLDQSALQAWGGEKTSTGSVHRVELKNLKPSTTYYFQAESGQASGTGSMGKSDVQSFTTKASGQAASAPATTGVDDHVVIHAGPIAANVTDKSAVLWWLTNDQTRTVVKYGKDKNNLDKDAKGETGENHRVELTGLEPNTTYYFQIMSHENKVRTDGQFKTEAAGFDQAKFRITNGPTIETVGKDTVVVAWSTNARSSSTVRYGTDANNLSQTAQAPWGQQTHRVVIRNLQPNTKYFFQVESAQAQGTGLSAKSNTAPFQTVKEGEQAMKNPNWR